jgi:bifunctional UDP-N-acetylglucosamine pyrophosphorylase / glucosamine-1-phosphate N-acetyltransferase
MDGSKLAVVILAAGQGTRMKSDRAKVLHEICGVPLFSLPVKLALDAGADPVVLVVGHQADEVKASALARFGQKLEFAIQAEQRGTGHAVMQALPALRAFRGRVLILYGDVPLLRKETIARLSELMDREKHVLTAVTMRLDDPTGYGRVVRDDRGRITRVVEQKDATAEERAIQESNAGIYLVDSEFLESALASLTPQNAQNEYYLTDIVEKAAKDPRGAGAVVVPNPQEVLGVNDRAQLAEVDRVLRSEILAAHMRAGVTIVDPATTYVGQEVTIGRDTVIHPGVHLRGRTKIGSGCTIDTGAILIDAVLHDRTDVRPYSILEGAEVRSGAIIGPFARLRPGAEVFEEAHVGNFVELKKTRLGRGAKANHLAYLGDATIGEGANVGAGTITCNYDGYGKYMTEIGDRVFVGSNATLVAPLKIGTGAYVAAGSTITDEVQPDSLVFGRAKQVEKTGRAKAVREEANARAAQAKKKG